MCYQKAWYKKLWVFLGLNFHRIHWLWLACTSNRLFQESAAGTIHVDPIETHYCCILYHLCWFKKLMKFFVKFFLQSICYYCGLFLQNELVSLNNSLQEGDTGHAKINNCKQTFNIFVQLAFFCASVIFPYLALHVTCTTVFLSLWA